MRPLAAKAASKGVRKLRLADVKLSGEFVLRHAARPKSESPGPGGCFEGLDQVGALSAPLTP
jgi:hypothetical protein